MKELIKIGRLSVIFEPADQWVGRFVDKRKGKVYLIIIPTIAFVWERRKAILFYLQDKTASKNSYAVWARHNGVFTANLKEAKAFTIKETVKAMGTIMVPVAILPCLLVDEVARTRVYKEDIKNLN